MPQRVRDREKVNAQARERRSTPEGRRKLRGYRLKADHGISLEEYEALLAEQVGVCAICKEPPRGGNHTDELLHVDHCHTTGVVRGLLCRFCNTALGLLQEDPQRMEAAVAYVRDGRWVEA